MLDRLRSGWVADETGRYGGVVHHVMHPELAAYDWRAVFAYAGEPDAGDGSASVKPAPPAAAVDVSPFSRWDVADVYGTSEGENDGRNWLVYGRLSDGRYFFLEAGCDYTGWG